MSRALFIGGFGSSREMLEPVGLALERHFEEVDVRSLREAEEDPDEVRRAAEGVDVFAHSGGIGPTANTRPSALHGLGVALPTAVPLLLSRTVAKQARMHGEDHGAAFRFERQSAAEILGHPAFHMRELFRVARMDGLNIAGHHTKMGTPATLAFFGADAYFTPSEHDRRWAEGWKVDLLSLPGQHDEPLLRPQETIDGYLAAANGGGRERTELGLPTPG